MLLERLGKEGWSRGSTQDTYRPAPLSPASHLNVTSLFELFDSAAAVGSDGAEGGAGSDGWEGLKGNQLSGKRLLCTPTLPSILLR